MPTGTWMLSGASIIVDGKEVKRDYSSINLETLQVLRWNGVSFIFLKEGKYNCIRLCCTLGKDHCWWWWLMFWQPAWKSSEDSDDDFCSGCQNSHHYWWHSFKTTLTKTIRLHNQMLPPGLDQSLQSSIDYSTSKDKQFNNSNKHSKITQPGFKSRQIDGEFSTQIVRAPCPSKNVWGYRAILLPPQGVNNSWGTLTFSLLRSIY